MIADLALGVWSESSIMPPSAANLVMTNPQVKRANAAIQRIPDRRGANLTVWFGTPGMGKTGAAWILCRTIHERAGVHAAYLDAPTPRGAGQDERTVLRAILASGVGRIQDRAFRSRTDQEIADMILVALFAADIRLLVIDEAGRLGFKGLEAVGILIDRAVMMDEDFHVVLVGMERLPETLRSNPRMRSRVASWEEFKPMKVDTFEAILMSAFPDFLGAMDAAERRETIEALHTETEGSLREVLSVISEAQAADIGAQGSPCMGFLLGLLRHQRANCASITAPLSQKSQERKRIKHQSAFPRRKG
jgi:DNA transposition AAA+ family ATPase